MNLRQLLTTLDGFLDTNDGIMDFRLVCVLPVAVTVVAHKLMQP
jgi:hypothetical protein